MSVDKIVNYKTNGTGNN